jgi:hypothetical protein
VLEIRVTGLDKVVAAIDRFPREIAKYMRAAGKEAGREVVDTVGLRQYPPAGEGNVPPTPFYIRGVGTQYATKNLHNSERYGTQFYITPMTYGATIGNRASYAKWLTDETDQAQHMAKIGWRKLIDVAHEKVHQIETIYDKWIAKLIKDLGL